MATAGDVFHNPITGEHVTVLLGAHDTGGRYLAAGVTLPAAGDRCVGEHCHPEVVEAVAVDQGEVTFRLGGEERVAGPGERIVIPRGTPHEYFNSGDGEARLVVEVWPAQRFELLVGTLIGLAREGRTDVTGRPDPLQRAVLLDEFADQLRPCGRWAWLGRVVVAVLAPVGRLSGCRPWYEHHAAPVDRVAVAPWPERGEPDGQAAAPGEAARVAGVACPS